VGQAEAVRDPRRRRDCRPEADYAVDVLRLGEPLERGLVVGRQDRPAVGEPEARSGGVAVGDDQEQAPGSRRGE